MKLRVQVAPCSTCIFRKDSPLDLKRLLGAVREKNRFGFEFFKGHRVCHHSHDAVCYGFWAKYRDKFQLGQIAQRLGIVEYVNDDTIGDRSMGRRKKQKRAHREYKQNLLKDGMARAGRIELPATMEDAIAAANARLESKQLPLTYTKKVPQRVVTATVKFKKKPKRIFINIELNVELTEEEFMAALNAARAAGRSTIGDEELERLLSEPHPINYRNQRGFVRGI